MGKQYRKGQSLIETLILTLSLMIFFISMESCHGKIKNRYNSFKIQKNYRN